MLTKKIFLASSSELKEDRKQFEILINRKNKGWVDQGVFLNLVVWEDFLDAVSPTRLQDEYNQAIRKCDIFVMMFCTKVGQYTEEEFETAFGHFKSTKKPFIFTYFKDTEISTGSANRKDLMTLWAFQEKLKDLGHYYTVYKNIDTLQLHFTQQLDKLAASGFIELKFDNGGAGSLVGTSNQGNLTGSGAIAQGAEAVAVGRGGVFVGGKNIGNINTGTHITGDFVHGDKVLGSKIGSQINTSGAYVRDNVHAGRDFIGRDQFTQGIPAGELELLFAPLRATVAQRAPARRQTDAVQQVRELEAEVAKGNQADDRRIGSLVDGLLGMVPNALEAVGSLFAAPILRDLIGPLSKFVLERSRVK